MDDEVKIDRIFSAYYLLNLFFKNRLPFLSTDTNSTSYLLHCPKRKEEYYLLFAPLLCPESVLS